MKKVLDSIWTAIFRLTVVALVAGAMLAAGASAGAAPAQPPQSNVIAISGDRRTLANVKMKILGIHVTPTDQGLVNRYSPYPAPLAPMPTVESPSAVSVPNLVLVPGPGYYPLDLSKSAATAPVIGTAQSHALFVDCPADNCWGSPDPRTFLTNLGNSRMIHVTDQYTGLTTNGRYTVGTALNIRYPIFTILGDNDILAIVHLAVATTKLSGLHHIYHVFLPHGVDVCASGSTYCYSPDIPATHSFCGYHTAVKFSDVSQLVYYTVEPYQVVNGCVVAQAPTASPNRALIDSTSNLLSHELFETITDPNVGSAFVARRSSEEFGAEIGDVCEAPGFRYPDSFIGARFYRIQLEYSNLYHACANVP